MRFLKPALFLATIFSGPAFAQERVSAAVQAAADANNAFAWELWSEVKTEVEPGENVLISPLSANLALSLAANGAVDETLDQMRQALAQDLTGFDQEQLNNALQSLVLDLISGVETDETLHIANAMWANADHFKFKSEFLFRANEYFRTTDADESIARSESFSDAQTLKNINQWVSKNTQGMIQQILADLDPNMVAILLNALFFEGQWTQSFQEHATREQDFTQETGETVSVQMMHNGKASVNYSETDSHKLVTLRFRKEKAKDENDFRGEAGRFALDLVLAKDGSVRELTQSDYENLLADAQLREVDLLVPKYKFDYKNTLNNELKALGMPRAFSGNAQFDDLGEDPHTGNTVPVAISQVLQKTAVEMSEGGFKAAAVTAIIFERTTAIPTGPEYSFVADKPFFLSLRDTRTGTILFQGIVNHPEWAE